MDEKSLSKLALYNSLHNGLYTYPNFKYVDNTTKFEVICKQHGSFYVNHSSHTNKRKPVGCPVCSGAKTKLTFKVWKERCEKIHENFYEYIEFEYQNTKTIAPIVCPLHGLFYQRCEVHLKGCGCPVCRYEKVAIKNGKTKAQFISDADKVHNFKYDYSKFDYVNNKTPSFVICKACNFEWQVRPDNHLHDETGCPRCAKTGIYGRAKNKDISYSEMDCVLYFVRIYNDEEEFLKVGLTAESINRRFSMLPYNFEVITYFNLKLDKARTIESECFKIFKDLKYTPIVPFSGKTECFNISSLESINSYLVNACSPIGS